MRKWQIELIGDLVYPREKFDTKKEAVDTAAFRCANRKLPFRVVEVREDGRLIENIAFYPVMSDKD